MEVITVEKLGTENGIERKKISLTNPKAENVMAKAHSYYTKDEKKEAKSNYKNK
tara:strand:+ start:147 stop:308 length:162 start_codon:yes stop_codon:yes gene_type:complete